MPFENHDRKREERLRNRRPPVVVATNAQGRPFWQVKQERENG